MINKIILISIMIDLQKKKMRLIITNIGTRDCTERGAEGKYVEMGWRETKPTSSTHLNEAAMPLPMGRGPAVGRDAAVAPVAAIAAAATTALMKNASLPTTYLLQPVKRKGYTT